MSYKKIIIIVIVSILICAGLFWLYLNFTSATIVINSPQDSDIYIKQSSNEFKKIGNTKATYQTQDTNTVIVEARKDSQVSQKSVSPEKNKTINVDLQFKELVKAEYFAPGPLTYPFIQNGFIYGINPQTNNIAAFPISPSTATAPPLPLLPFLKQIIWQTSREFIYVTLGRGTGFVSNGKVQEGNYSSNIAIATSEKNNYILLNKDGFYFSPKSNFFGATKLTDLVENSSPGVFADDNYLYSLSLIYNNSLNKDDVEPTGKETILIIYGQDGKKINEYKLAITSKSSKVVSLDKNTITVLSPEGLTIIDTKTNQIKTQAFSFGEVQDMVLYKDKLLLLGTEGLWEYNQQSGEYNKIAVYPENQKYVPNSLVVLDGVLFLSTSVTDEALINKSGSTVRSAIYKISL